LAEIIDGSFAHQTVNTSSLKTLAQANGHDSIDILKIDIEGNEWSMIESIVEDAVNLSVKQILIELHFGDIDGSFVPYDLVLLLRMFRSLEASGFVPFSATPNIPPRTIEYSFRYTSVENGNSFSKVHLCDEALLIPSDFSNTSAVDEFQAIRTHHAFQSHGTYKGQNNDGYISTTNAISLEYQAADMSEGFDYGVYRWPGTQLFFRGPNWFGMDDDSTSPLPHLAFIGAAQVFGRGAKRPYPALVSTSLQRPWFNFGVGGVGPQLYLKYAPIMKAISRCPFVFINVFSGRSVNVKLPNGTVYESEGGAIFKRPDGGLMYWKQLFFESLVGSQEEMGAAVVSSIRNQLVSDIHELKQAIELTAKSLGNPVPKIIYTSFHFRDTDFDHGFEEAADDFPQYVDTATETKIKSAFQWTINGAEPSMRGYKNYYPSEEHHELFAKKVVKAMREWGFS